MVSGDTLSTSRKQPIRRKAASASISEKDGKLDLVAPEDAKITEQASVDGSRRWFPELQQANTVTVEDGSLDKLGIGALGSRSTNAGHGRPND